ncbi:MAG: protein-L-isoaspartate(D-aspartate) O-methyltransferase [Candidatus Pacearchaeota archaeon]
MLTKKDLLKELKKEGIEEKILEAIDKIDRKKFVLKEQQDLAYINEPLLIGFGQTISQPYTVAFMLQNSELKKGDKVLEIGTGSGWNASLISFLIGEKGEVYTIERIKELYNRAREKLKNYKNIRVFLGDGSKGLKEFAPYDKIIITAASEKIQENIKNQLKEEGVLIAPIGPRFCQKLIKIKKKNGKFSEISLGDFVFVPLIEDSSN